MFAVEGLVYLVVKVKCITALNNLKRPDGRSGGQQGGRPGGRPDGRAKGRPGIPGLSWVVWPTTSRRPQCQLGLVCRPRYRAGEGLLARFFRAV